MGQMWTLRPETVHQPSSVMSYFNAVAPEIPPPLPKVPAGLGRVWASVYVERSQDSSKRPTYAQSTPYTLPKVLRHVKTVKSTPLMEYTV